MFDWIERGSYLGIILFLTLTGVGLPIPEEVPIVAAGVASKAAALKWYYALPACMVGALLGDSLMYAIGRFFGARVLKEHPWWSGFLTAERERTIENLMQKHGLKAFFVARFLVGLRSPFYLTAGILRVKYRWFLFADFVCASVVIGGFFGLAYLFGDRITSLIQSADLRFRDDAAQNRQRCPVFVSRRWHVIRHSDRSKLADSLQYSLASRACLDHPGVCYILLHLLRP